MLGTDRICERPFLIKNMLREIYCFSEDFDSFFCGQLLVFQHHCSIFDVRVFLTIYQFSVKCGGTLRVAFGLLCNQKLSIWARSQSLNSSSVINPVAMHRSLPNPSIDIEHTSDNKHLMQCPFSDQPSFFDPNHVLIF